MTKVLKFALKSLRCINPKERIHGGQVKTSGMMILYA